MGLSTWIFYPPVNSVVSLELIAHKLIGKAAEHAPPQTSFAGKSSFVAELLQNFFKKLCKIFL